MRTDLFALALPDSFWATTSMTELLANRDVGQLLRLVQKQTGASQTQIGVAAGLSQAQVSEIMSGARRVTSIDVFARIVAGLKMPDPYRTLLFLGNLDLVRPATAVLGADPQTGSAGLHGDVTAIYTTRSQFLNHHPPHALFSGATTIRAAGISLNLLCQHFADNHLRELLAAGARLQCLFLAPNGEAIKQREREEHHQPGVLSSLTQLNIEGLLRRVRDRLPDHLRPNLEVATYDETVRFNLLFVDDELCIVQPYLPDARGVDSPTLVIRKGHKPGLYQTFEQVFTSLWERGATHE
jgi:transcriptional regulator with XRE-family HTH domain